MNFNPQNLEQETNDKNLDQVDKAKLKMSKLLVLQLQKLFAEMMMTNVKYLNPSDVLDSIVDDSGHKIRIHE